MRKVYNKMRDEKGKMRNCYFQWSNISAFSFLLSAFSFLLLVSCSQEDFLPQETDSDVVEVTATIGDAPHTRVSQPEDNVYTFDDKDKIHIVGWYGAWDDYNRPWEMALDAWWNDAVSTYDATSGKWKTEPYMRWQNGDGLDHHFLAWWPENIIKSNENLTAVDITVTGDYNKDDILVAHWSDKRPEDNVLNLKFKHLLSRFDVHLFFRDEYPNPENISIQTHLKKTAVCDFLSGTVKEIDKEGVIGMKLIPSPDTKCNWSGTCITVPQDFAGPLLTIKFIGNGEEKTITYTHPEDLVFRSGERTTLYLYVGKNEAKVITTGNGYPGGWSDSETELN